MRCADRRLARGVAAAAWAAAVALLTSCGGNSTETTLIGGGVQGGTGADEVVLATPVGPNTTEIVVDSGPDAGFSLGAANIPYVTVTVCTPGSSTGCATIDHVILDTGSIGLRLLRSTVASLALPPVQVPADATSGTPAGDAVECYPFVLGGLWGPLAQADVRIGGELAESLPVQIIDDAQPPTYAPTRDCIDASSGGLLNSVSLLQANGVLGVGMLAYDCGLTCITGDYASLGYTIYYSCAGVSCVPAALPSSLQVQNPVAHFPVNNNGTLIAMPALPDLGAGVARGRLVFGIGTQSNNQISPAAQIYSVETDPASASYLYLTTTLGTQVYPDSYVDSGSNAMFFDDTSIPFGCQSSSGSTTGGWFCPSSFLRRTATFTDSFGSTGQVDFSVGNADALFSTPSLAFSNLAGSVNQGSRTFVWGMPFYYGRTVYTSIWGQALAANGPWYAF